MIPKGNPISPRFSGRMGFHPTGDSPFFGITVDDVWANQDTLRVQRSLMGMHSDVHVMEWGGHSMIPKGNPLGDEWQRLAMISKNNIGLDYLLRCDFTIWHTIGAMELHAIANWGRINR